MKLGTKNHKENEQMDEIWQRGLLTRINSPISQWQAQLPRGKSLAAASQSLVLQEMTRQANLYEKPDAGSTPRSETPIPQGTAVLVIYEYMEWYLIAVMQEPWQMGWVERDAVRAKTDLPLRVNDEHYLETIGDDNRGFLRIVPGTGYESIRKMNEPAGQEKYKIKYIIMHYTTGLRMESTINYFLRAASGVSAHLLIGRDGRIVQFLPFNRIAYHAGTSWWNETKHINNCSIGIELDNAGRLTGLKVGDVKTWKSGTTPIPGGRVEEAAYWKRPASVNGWEKFPEAQLKAAWQVVQALKEKYDIKDILGHGDVNLLNREDPGPLLVPVMQNWRQELFGRPEPDVPHFKLSRQANSYQYLGGEYPNESTSSYPSQLPKGSQVTGPKQLNYSSAWTQVKVRKAPGVEKLKDASGWVRTNMLTRESQTNIADTSNHYLTTSQQPLYKLGSGQPTPPLLLPAGTKVRKQEVGPKWTLVVVEDYVIQGETGFQVWIKSESDIFAAWSPDENS